MEVHFQGEIEENFFPPQMCFHTLGGGEGGSGRGGKNPHFLFFFLKASLKRWNQYLVFYFKVTFVAENYLKSEYVGFTIDDHDFQLWM